MPFIPYTPIHKSSEQMDQASQAFYEHVRQRRSVRQYSNAPVPATIIERIILSASTAPSGANKQPWMFCAISNPALKSEIRKAAEKEELENYQGRMGSEWLKDLEPLGTDEHKGFLETAPWLIAVFKKTYDIENGVKRKNYYVQESVGIACGFLLIAIYEAGLAALTHTPSPMQFLKKLLKRPENESPFLLIPVGYPEEGATVPDIKRKKSGEVIEWYV